MSPLSWLGIVVASAIGFLYSALIAGFLLAPEKKTRAFTTSDLASSLPKKSSKSIYQKSHHPKILARSGKWASDHSLSSKAGLRFRFLSSHTTTDVSTGVSPRARAAPRTPGAQPTPATLAAPSAADAE